MTVTEFLRSSHLFKGLPSDHLQLLLPCCREETAEKEAVIFREGEPAKSLYVVEEGRIGLRMTRDRPDGSSTGPTTVASVGPGEAFGWSAIIEPRFFTLTAIAVEPSKLILMEGTALREVLNLNRDIGYLVMVNVANLITERLAETREAFVYDRSWVHYQQRLSSDYR